MRKDVELYLKDHHSLKYNGLWDYFRARKTDNKLYILQSTILDGNTLIGYVAWEVDEEGMLEHRRKCNV